jgi:hypothetical protein
MRKLASNLIICTSISLFFMASCNSKPQHVKDIKEKDAKEIAKAVQSAEQAAMPRFTFNPLPDDISPKTTITVSYLDLSYSAEEPGTCVDLNKEDFESREIPTADAACQCWWAGMGADYYLQKVGENVEVYRRDAYEETPPAELPWKLVKVLSKK